MSAAIELCLRIECKFINVCTGENCNSKIFVTAYDDASELLKVFCSRADKCIYQTKLIYNDKIMDKNKTLQEQFYITESILTFNVIQLHNETVLMGDLEWYVFIERLGFMEAILPAAKTMNIICNESIYPQVSHVSFSPRLGFQITYNDDERAIDVPSNQKLLWAPRNLEAAQLMFSMMPNFYIQIIDPTYYKDRLPDILYYPR